MRIALERTVQRIEAGQHQPNRGRLRDWRTRASGGAPQQHRIDSLSAAYRNTGGKGRKPLTQLYDDLATTLVCSQPGITKASLMKMVPLWDSFLHQRPKANKVGHLRDNPQGWSSHFTLSPMTT